ncbi:YbjN domain-containing protein [Oerskovia sp. M15]
MSYFSKPDDALAPPTPALAGPGRGDRPGQGMELRDRRRGRPGRRLGRQRLLLLRPGRSAGDPAGPGRWSRTLSSADQVQVALLANEVNQSRIWPKVYSRVEGDHLGVYAEVSTDLEFGVADDQLGQLVECGLFSGLQFFEQLDERFPVPDADAPEADVVEGLPL